MAEKIRYRDLLDYSERLYFSGNASKVARGEELLGLVSELDERRANNGNKDDLFLSKADIDFVTEKGFKTEPFWVFLKEGKAPEYGSPLIDYQDAYIDYMTNPMAENRIEHFEELKTTEKSLTTIGNSQEIAYMSVARGDANLASMKPSYNVGNLSYIKQAAYGRNGLHSQIDAVYEDLAKEHDPALVGKLKALEALVAASDIASNDVQLYSTSKFVNRADGKEELHFTVNAPVLKLKDDFNIKISDNEALTLKVTDKGIEGAKYTDFNVYFDDLVAYVPDPKKGMVEKTGKKAADYLKQNPNEDYPDPAQIKQVKIDNALKWVYVLPDMSYPDKNAPEAFTTDYQGVRDSIVSDRLKDVSTNINKMIEQDKFKAQEWKPSKQSLSVEKHNEKEVQL